VDTNSTRKPGARTAAVVVATEDGRLNRTVTAALASRFTGEAVQILPSFFKPEFVSDGLFNNTFNGSEEISEKLELAHSLDTLVLGRQDVQYSENPALDNVITATMRLNVAFLSLSSKGDSQKWAFTSYGPGFTKEVARQRAEERLIKQITADTKMSLQQ
jgi:hypothetical protein